MTFRIRAATPGDLEQLYEMAKLGGSGFTNLPADRASLAGKLERAAAAYAEPRDALPEGPGDELFVTILENVATGGVRGTAQIFACVGKRHPFYSYRLTTLTQHSRELDRTFRAEMLNLVTDLEGSSEVGGLFLHPAARAGGLGLLLARSRYLFIAMHRGRFAPRILAELRGVIDERGGSAFWDAVGGKFFGMGFHEADHFNALNGHQFIADLMPKHPVYVAMLPDTARTAIGMPHPSGRPAMRMLENEGFAYEGYVDIFDGGPTLTARTDQVRTVADARTGAIAHIAAPEGSGPARKVLVATGRLGAFRCTLGEIAEGPDGLVLDPIAAAALDVRAGDTVWHVAR